jgi:hypothetical protein
MEETAGIDGAVRATCRRLWGFEGLLDGLRGCTPMGRRAAADLGAGAGDGMADIAAANRT